MYFKAEKELVHVLKQTLKSRFNTGRFEIFQEVSLGYGIADLVISFCDNKSNVINNYLPTSRLDIIDISIFNVLNKIDFIKVDDLVNITKINRKEIVISVDKLNQLGYIKLEDGTIIKQKEYEFPFYCNFAVEAKLKNWKNALKQAYRYRWFAEYSYVVLDNHFSKMAICNIELFVKYNIGLATISPNGIIKVYHNPTRKKPFDVRMKMLFSEYFLNNYELNK
ncbi:hypothetical protein [Larkinella humicola]|uniref:Uncharacterized protein n=1 Tax=Larkinella humicola TaxID=2607654 RepID=A0A5N1JU03_9BACT|nr:hypothetical protein [Larkinella humicola]KAA9357283.1 hypothetical protein F0P93_05975 [Larkinella humicola]